MVTEGQQRDVRSINLRVGGISVAAGVGVVLGGPSPTGSTLIDSMLLVVVTAVCISCIALAPWTLSLAAHHAAR